MSSRLAHRPGGEWEHSRGLVAAASWGKKKGLGGPFFYVFFIPSPSETFYETFMKRHPWCDGRFGEVSSLGDSERIITFIAGHTASGDLQALERDCGFLAPENHGAAVEAVLQTHLFAGYPRTINAMAVLERLGWRVGGQEGDTPNWSAWTSSGEQLCGQIYAHNYPRLRERIAALHPDLDRWMVETGYGRVLSRPGLSPRLRELCVVSVLAGQNVAPQLHSHLKGALHVGASLEECGSVLSQVRLIWGEEAFEESSAVLGALISRGKSD